MRRAAVGADGRCCHTERVDDRFLGGVGCGGEEWADRFVGHHFYRDGITRASWIETGIGGGKCEKEVAASVVTVAPNPGGPDRGPLCQPFALVRQKRRVGRHNDDDRSVSLRLGSTRRYLIGVDLSPYRHSVDMQVFAPPVV